MLLGFTGKLALRAFTLVACVSLVYAGNRLQGTDGCNGNDGARVSEDGFGLRLKRQQRFKNGKRCVCIVPLFVSFRFLFFSFLCFMSLFLIVPLLAVRWLVLLDRTCQ